MDRDLQSIQEARHLLDRAHAAFRKFEDFSEEGVERILEAISRAGIEASPRLAALAVEETGYGNVADKTAKNLFCADDVYRAIRPLKTVGIVREDAENRVIEVASPVGVVVGIIPSTNPTSTTIYKALIALKGRNAIVFSPHPSAVRCIGETARLIAEAAEGAGAPAGLIGCMDTPTMEGTRELMTNRRTALILATGGPGLVRAAYSAGKPAFGVGPGNVPAYIEKSADVARAVGHVLTGKCFDHGTLCSSEQSLISDRAIADRVLEALAAGGAYICGDEDRARLERLIERPGGGLNTRIVGQSAARIAEMAGIRVPDGTRALVGRAEGVGPAHPLSREKLSPILAFYTVNDWKEGCEKCIEILEFGGMGHTLALHTTDDEVIRQFALYKPAFRICVNTPAALGAVGYTTNLFPSMTLGCGAAGGNITSDNISPLHLINLKRVAFGVREVKPVQAPASNPGPKTSAKTRPAASGNRDKIAEIVDGWLGRRSSSPAPPAPAAAQAPPRPEGIGSAPAAPPREAPEAQPGSEVGPAAPPLATYNDLDSPKATAPTAPAEAAAVVCEDDVRAASRSNAKIAVTRKTIITPSARELGEELDLFVVTD